MLQMIRSLDLQELLENVYSKTTWMFAHHYVTHLYESIIINYIHLQPRPQ